VIKQNTTRFPCSHRCTRPVGLCQFSGRKFTGILYLEMYPDSEI
jgi:hypothetical protein